MLRKIKIYADTSVFGGVFDNEFKDHSQLFFDLINKSVFQLMISDVVRSELQNAPQKIKEFAAKYYSIAEYADITIDAINLQHKYIEAGIVSPKFITDALHVALATTNNCNMIVSWNFKHIVNFQRIPLYNSINLVNGYNQINIYSPSEVIYAD